MVASKNNKVARKKSRVSKHVLQGQEKHAKGEQLKGGNGPTDGDNNNKKQERNTPSKRSPPPPQRHIKDPSEAADYLNSWKQSKSSEAEGAESTTTWKFNKNTQSWLIRHMYEPEKVAKGVFSLLLEYLQGLEGKTTKDRMQAEARRRALRYKEFEKTLSSKSAGGGDDDDDNNKKDTQQDDDDNNKSKVDATTSKMSQSDLTKEEQEEEAARWVKLSENDKRKEYKRARKILDIVNDQ